jgi:hypothetical protein
MYIRWVPKSVVQLGKQEKEGSELSEKIGQMKMQIFDGKQRNSLPMNPFPKTSRSALVSFKPSI